MQHLWSSLLRNELISQLTIPSVGASISRSPLRRGFFLIPLVLVFSNTEGNFNTAVGPNAGSAITTGSYNIDIGNGGVGGESGVTRIGTAGTQTATYISGIRETPLTQGAAVAVGITVDGQLGVRASSARFKEAIQPMGKSSEAIHSLRPVTFRYKKELDPKGTRQFGLVAEDVAKVNPDLIVPDEQAKPFTVRYEEINAMLLNEFLKEHRKVEEQGSKIEQQEAKIAKQQQQIETLSAGLQKMSARIELSKSAPQTVLNNH